MIGLIGEGVPGSFGLRKCVNARPLSVPGIEHIES